MPSCKFVRVGNYCVCEVCGLKLETDEDPSSIYATCPGTLRTNPPFLKKVAHYVAAMAEHVASGLETCTDEETNARLNMCLNCEKYDPNGVCTVCGCKVGGSRNALRNKLRMKSQKCPLKKW